MYNVSTTFLSRPVARPCYLDFLAGEEQKIKIRYGVGIGKADAVLSLDYLIYLDVYDCK